MQPTCKSYKFKRALDCKKFLKTRRKMSLHDAFYLIQLEIMGITVLVFELQVRKAKRKELWINCAFAMATLHGVCLKKCFKKIGHILRPFSRKHKWDKWECASKLFSNFLDLLQNIGWNKADEVIAIATRAMHIFGMWRWVH